MMLINSAILSFLLLTTSLLSNATTIDSYVEISQVTVSGIKLNHKENDVYKILGKPHKVVSREPNEVIAGKAKELHYSGIKIYLVGGEILRLECKGSICLTDQGINVGDSKKKVEQAYGAIASNEFNVNKNKIYYKFKKGSMIPDGCYFIFHFKNEKVIKIEYFVDYT